MKCFLGIVLTHKGDNSVALTKHWDSTKALRTWENSAQEKPIDCSPQTVVILQDKTRPTANDWPSSSRLWGNDIDLPFRGEPRELTHLVRVWRLLLWGTHCSQVCGAAFSLICLNS